MRREARQRGQNLAELALVAPLLIALFIGVADLGRAFHAFIVMENAAREAARYGASFPDRLTQNTAPSAKLRAADEVLNSGLAVAEGSVVYGTPAGPLDAGQVYIQVSKELAGDGFQPHEQVVQARVYYGFGFISGFLGIAPITLQGSADMLVLYDPV